MAKIPIVTSDYRRRVAAEVPLVMKNRFIEKNPALSDGEASFIARPALRAWKQVGSGPIRGMYTQPGTFDNDAFVMSYNSLFRLHRDDTETVLGNDFFGGDAGSRVNMTATGDVGEIRPHLFIADGQTLRVYSEDGPAHGTLTATVNPANGDVVRIDSVYYQITTGSVDAGTPAGTLANPWLVAQGLTIIATYTNLYRAINDSGVAGVDYSTALEPHPTVQAWSATLSGGLRVKARIEGIAGNAIVTTETGANMAWGAGTLTGGGAPFLSVVPTPADIGVIDVKFVSGFVVVIPAQGEGVNGRFYWIEPGEVVIDPLNFATAERSPDPIYQCVVFNDQFWLPGQNSTEVWFFTGDPDAPVQRLQGVVFDRGTHPGTALQVRDRMVIVDSTGGVFEIKGGERRISTPDIEERIRKAIAQQSILL